MLIETITAKLQADVGQFQQGLAVANRSVAQLDNTSQGASRGVGVMRNALTALAFQSTGLTGPIGRLTSGLLMLAGGSTLVIGVAAGVAAIGLAFRHLTRDTRALRDASKELHTTLQGIAAEAAPEAAAFAEAQARAEVAQEALRKAEQAAARFVGVDLGPEGSPARRDAERAAAALKLAQENATLAGNIAGRLRDRMREARQEIVRTAEQEQERLAELEAKLQQVVLEVQDFAIETPIIQIDIDETIGKFFEWKTATDQLRESLEFLQRIRLPEFEAEQAERIFQMTGGMEGLPMFGIPSPEEVAAQLDAINEAAGIVGVEMNKQFAQMGLDAMQSLARSLLSGARDIKKLLFGLLLDFSLGGIFAGIGKALGLGGVSNLVAPTMDLEAPTLDLAAAPTADLHATPMALQFAPATNWPPPRTPFDMARDAEIQRWLREAVLVARSDGFR